MVDETSLSRTPLAPTGSNAATSFGGALAVVLIVLFHWQGPPGFEAAIAVVITGLVTYFHSVLRSLVNRQPLE